MALVYMPYEGPIVTREEAKAQGVRRYFTAEQCGKGHTSQRYVSSRGCAFCQLQRVYDLNTNRPEKAKKYSRTSKIRNRGKNIADTARWREENPDKVEAYRVSYYEKNKEILFQKNKEWRKKNTDKILGYREEFKERYPEYDRVQHARRRARKQNAGGRFGVQDIRLRAAAQKWKCAWCRKGIKSVYHADHIVPLARGGTNEPSNIQLLCPTCNMSKGAKDPIEWARRNGRLL